jgi:uncharacterized protein
MTPKEKEAALVRLIGRFESSIVAFSGGVDSSYLAFMAQRVMGDKARCVTALSPSVSKMQQKLVREFVDRYRLNHVFVQTRELDNPAYSRNTSDRCYFCKSELFGFLQEMREKEQVDIVFDGSNADDVRDYRPGRKAADEGGVMSPLIEVGMTKEEIRQLSRGWGLPTWDLPAMPCLSSRLPYGVEVTPEKLRQVEKAESVMREMGFREFRVRHHEELARLEIAQSEIKRMLDLEVFDEVNRRLKDLGYHYVTLDLQGFRSGSLNELLTLAT